MNELFCVIKHIEGDTVKQICLVPKENLELHLLRLKKHIDCYLEDLRKTSTQKGVS